MSKYSVVATERFQKELASLDRAVQRRILKRLYELEVLEVPQSRCKALVGPLSGLWRLRVGDYRVVLDIQNDQLVIVALDVDHRSRIYEK